MTDAQTVGVSLGAFFFFLLMQVIAFRLQPRGESIYRTLAALLGCWLASLAAGWVIWRGGAHGAIYLLLHGFLVTGYIFGVLVIADSSLHLRLLAAVARSGSRGISGRQLRRAYNPRTVVGRRLARLAASGEVMVAGGRYRRARAHSPLWWREQLTAFLQQLFP